MHDASKGSRDNVDVDVSHEPNYAGQAIYSPITLAVYDLIVLALSNPLIWRCPTGRILQLYDRHVTDNHLDVGVGTRWYLDRCHFPNPGTTDRLARPQSELACGSLAPNCAVPAGAIPGGYFEAVKHLGSTIPVRRADLPCALPAR